jgi:PAS domain S-box-containing protein
MSAVMQPDGGLGAAGVAAAAAPVLLWTAHDALAREWLSPAWVAHTGMPLERLQGEGWLDAVHPDDRARCRGIIAASVEARRPYALDFRLSHRDGGFRWMLDSGAPQTDEADGRYAGGAVDIDDRKTSEEQLAEHAQTMRIADRRHAAFLSTLAHAMRNPLAPIANAASVLRTLEDDQPTLKRLREILERQVERLGHLVDDLADATRAVQGQVSLVHEDVTLGGVIQAALSTTSAVVAERGHEVRVALPSEPVTLRGDPARLAQALAQLVDNAARYSPQPGIVDIAGRCRDDRVDIEVSDQGRGISAAFLPHVFELFAQEDGGSGSRAGGLGIGLAIAQRIAHLHGGDITAASHGHGQGARFTLTLPRAHRPVLPEGNGAASVERQRVLVIAPDVGVRSELRVEMERWGSDVRAAASLEEGLRLAADLRPQLVLCEVGVASPGDLRPLRAGPGERPPLLAAVATPEHGGDEARVLAEGWDGFLSRPLEAATLGALLRVPTPRQT